MKRIFALILTVMCMVLATLSVSANTVPPVTVMLDGVMVDCAAYGQEPVIVEGRTLVPLRAIFEALGATVEWEEKTRTVTSELDGTTIKLTIGENKLYKNGEAVELDVPAQIMNSRTLVPVRAVSESFGVLVDWNNDTRTVILTSKIEYEQPSEPLVPSNNDVVPEKAKKVLTSCLDAITDMNLDEASKYLTKPDEFLKLGVSDWNDFLSVVGIDRETLTAYYLDSIADGSEDYRIFCEAVTDFTIDLVLGLFDKMDYDVVSYEMDGNNKIKFEAVLYIPDMGALNADFETVFSDAMNLASYDLLGMGDAISGLSQKEMLDMMAPLFKKHAEDGIKKVVENATMISYGEASYGTLVKVDGEWFVDVEEEFLGNIDELKFNFFE